MDGTEKLVIAKFRRACALDASGDAGGARQAYLTVLHLDPSHFGALINLAALAGRAGNRAAAKGLLLQAVTIAPKSPLAHVNLALVVLDDDVSLAREHYEAALHLDPENRDAHKGLAVVLLRMGEEAAAIRHGRIGFGGGAQKWAYRGPGVPVSILMVISAMGNIAIDRLVDDRLFQKWTLVAEFYDPETPLPPHDVVLNCVGDADLARGAAAFAGVERVLSRTRARILNPPSVILETGRVAIARRLRALPGVVTPQTELWPRGALVAAEAPGALATAGFGWPLLLRSPGFQTGHHFVQVDGPEALGAAVAGLPGEELLVIAYVDTRSPDGKFRKYRVMFIGGELYPLHLAISHHWKVHYFSADMADCAENRAEDEAFLRDIVGTLGANVVGALRSICRMVALDYGGIDFALDAEGRVVVFEANASMLIPAIAGSDQWAYRIPAFARAMAATLRLLSGTSDASGTRVESTG